MKKVFALLFIGSTLTFAACQSKPKTEETTTTMSTDTTTMATDSAMSTTVTTMESTSAAADSAK